MLGTWLIDEEEERQALEVLRSRSLFRHYGPNLLHKTSEFESAFARHTGSDYALAVNSGTSALRCALQALGVKKGDEVLVTPCTFVATINAIALAGAIPVFCEIDASLGLCPDHLGEKLTSRTVGVLPVHLQGFCCHIDAIHEFAKRHGLWLLEDCAQSFGAYYRDKHTGTFGEAGAFSLQAHKTITCGEGGVLIASNKNIFLAARRYQDQGGERNGDGYPRWDGESSGFGENLKMNELQSAVALAQLGKIGHIRNVMRDTYRQVVDGVDLGGREIRENPDADGCLPYSFIFYARDSADRSAIFSKLQGAGVPCDGLYDEPLYKSAPLVHWSEGRTVPGCVYPELKPQFKPCPRAEQWMSKIVRIPLSPAYSSEDMEYMVNALSGILKK